MYRLLCGLFFLLSLLGFNAQAQQLQFASDEDFLELGNRLNTTFGTTVIFIPGILGSKLAVEVDGNPTTIWGGRNTSDPNLELKPNQIVVPTIFDKAELQVFRTSFSQNIYGQAITDLRDQDFSGQNNVEIFPYDWRQSNAVSAASLQDWLCKKLPSLKDRSIVFVAHSMGGLVLKNWLVSFRDQDRQCLGDTPTTLKNELKIERIFFAGTPHQGAPKFMSALMGDYQLVGVKIINDFLTKGLINYGPSFESIYELLPIVQSETCRAEANIRSEYYIEFLDKFGNTTPIDMFRWQSWQKLGIPKTNPISAEDYYGPDGFLSKQLARAERMLCRLWRYDFNDLQDKITYIYGRGSHRDTASKYQLTRWSSAKPNVSLLSGWHRLGLEPEDVIVFKSEPTYGDGTVPESIATRTGSAGVGFNQSHMEQGEFKDHMTLLDGVVFSKMIRFTLNKIKSDQVTRQAAISSENRNLIVDYLASNGKMLPRAIQTNATASSATEADIMIANINSGVLEQNRLNILDVYRLARTSNDEATKSLAYSEVIQSTDISPNMRKWAINNYADELLKLEDYSTAKAVTGLATIGEPAPDLSLEVRKLNGKIKNKAGWANLKVGDYQQALDLFRSAESFGDAQASMGVEETLKVLPAGRT